MRKLLLPLVLVTTVLLGSCNKESYYHTMSLQYPDRVSIVYADQTRDSVAFWTTDNFQIVSGAEWLVVPDSMKQGYIQNQYRYVWSVVSLLIVEPNVTGHSRTAQLSIHCMGNDEWNQTATVTYRQLHWLDITSPSPNYAYNDGVITDAAFQLTDSATQVSDSLCFRVHGNWELTDGSFVHPVVQSGEAGRQTVALTLDANPSTDERQEKIVLTSNGVSTPVTIKQTGRKKVEE